MIVAVCMMFGFFAGCTAEPGDQPSASSATETIHVDGYYVVGPSLDALIEESPFVIAGRVLDFRYDIQYDIEGPNGEEPSPPDAITVVAVEVTAVFAGTLKPGDRIEVYQMGGVMDKVMFVYDEVPYLPDHEGRDLVMFLQTWDYLGSENTSYRVTDSFEGMWLNDSGRLSLLWGVNYRPEDAQSTQRMPGAPDFPVSMTLSELEKAIAEHK